MMSDISGLDLPLDVKAKLAELDLELSEGWLQIVCDDHIITPEAFTVVSCMLKGGALSPHRGRGVTNHRIRRTMMHGPIYLYYHCITVLMYWCHYCLTN